MCSGDYGRESAETRDILGALVLADRWLMFDLFSFCEIELVKRVDKSNVVETLDAISNVQRAKRLKVREMSRMDLSRFGSWDIIYWRNTISFSEKVPSDPSRRWHAAQQEGDVATRPEMNPLLLNPNKVFLAILTHSLWHGLLCYCLLNFLRVRENGQFRLLSGTLTKRVDGTNFKEISDGVSDIQIAKGSPMQVF